MAKLNQIIAIEKNVKSEAYSAITQAIKVAQKPELFSGHTRTYSRAYEDGEELPADIKPIQLRVSELIMIISDSQAEAWQVLARKEWSNTAAKADITANGTVLVSQAPVTFLLQLEKLLNDLKTFIGNLPELTTDEQWSHDPASGEYRSEMTRTTRTKKTPRAIVKYDATPEHPAQTEMIVEDVLAGYWETVKRSAALPYGEKQRYLKNIQALLLAVKQAREEANSISEVDTPSVRTLVDYVFT